MSFMGIYQFIGDLALFGEPLLYKSSIAMPHSKISFANLLLFAFRWLTMWV